MAPGALVAADVDGNGRPDVLYMPGQWFALRDQSIRSINAAIRDEDGSLRFTTQTLPAALSSMRVEYGFGDFDGDRKTDLIAVVPIDPGGGQPLFGCDIPPRADPSCPLARRRQLPASADWKDCAAGQEVTPPWARWTELGVPGKLQVADTNGDGLADVMMPTAWARSPSEALVAVWDRVSAAASKPRPVGRPSTFR